MQAKMIGLIKVISIAVLTNSLIDSDDKLRFEIINKALIIKRYRKVTAKPITFLVKRA